MRNLPIRSTDVYYDVGFTDNSRKRESKKSEVSCQIERCSASKDLPTFILSTIQLTVDMIFKK